MLTQQARALVRRGKIFILPTLFSAELADSSATRISSSGQPQRTRAPRLLRKAEPALRTLHTRRTAVPDPIRAVVWRTAPAVIKKAEYFQRELFCRSPISDSSGAARQAEGHGTHPGQRLAQDLRYRPMDSNAAPTTSDRPTGVHAAALGRRGVNGRRQLPSRTSA